LTFARLDFENREWAYLTGDTLAGLKPDHFSKLCARLKSCPDYKTRKSSLFATCSALRETDHHGRENRNT